MGHYTKKSSMPVSAEELFAWHERKGAFERLSPPWEKVRLLRKDPSIEVGAEVHMQLQKGPLSLPWIARHTKYDPPKQFVDIQVKGPFSSWEHTHNMLALNEKESILEDSIAFRTPLGIGEGFAKAEIGRLFTCRHAVMKADLAVQNLYRSSPKKVAVTGASGLIGTQLCAFLRSAGHTVLPVVRRAAQEGEIAWDLEKGTIEKEKLEGLDAVVHLAGENISSGRWTKQKKAEIYDSRLKGVRLLVSTCNALAHPPQTLLVSSGISYYGDRGSDSCTETTEPGEGFLASICIAVEKEAVEYEKGRVVLPRFGIVLSPQGGALAKMLPAFSFGLGGCVGSGEQWMSWIGLDDCIYQLYGLLQNPEFQGGINICAPYPVTNREFTKTLGKVLYRPTLLPVPASAVRTIFGEMADETILASHKVLPESLLHKDTFFSHPHLEGALRHVLGRVIQE